MNAQLRRNDGPVDALSGARQAWRDLMQAEGQMARLRSYPHPSRAMRDDLTRWSLQYGEARRRLDALLTSTH